MSRWSLIVLGLVSMVWFWQASATPALSSGASFNDSDRAFRAIEAEVAKLGTSDLAELQQHELTLTLPASQWHALAVYPEVMQTASAELARTNRNVFWSGVVFSLCCLAIGLGELWRSRPVSAPSDGKATSSRMS
ncbi:hypothetical protein Mal4_38310 [Maioricimonas rarisocia]|uniref:Uncharacterized protein n=1 Tax=Maioricimonas rarisocia TaxID=2528026 RepID=A0A517ZAG6_9PLAN|nr:hypothetical protein [Maioricimonas rarisocia]QDU39486.1 hypothetical protein Mal4_38310 [Maioricimonas rarisocia]